jgi:hypothetical protein
VGEHTSAAPQKIEDPQIVQRPFAQEVRITNAILCVRDDFLGENFHDKIAAIRKPKGCARHFECEAHNALGLGVECEAVQKFGDGHDALLAVQAGAQIVSLSHRRLMKSRLIGRAAADDERSLRLIRTLGD